MLELVQTVWNFVASVLHAGWDLLVAAAVLCGGLLHHLHVDAPRLEGLLVGIALAWLLLRRDRHPLLRALSAPLKLVLDILDLAWDQVVEFAGDVWGVGKSWTVGSVGWVWNTIAGGGSWVMERLKSVKSKLEKGS
ncbi:hypothetical protein CMI47_14285 [Candidatus Pacearchaeota archaeon]|nr:hypothetical protein [Candidatus Pacearchaeota archaeon]|tara:strand:+ start:40 stop:447 length:408 start_codon:yes stop_codon:yes gene_type:complete